MLSLSVLGQIGRWERNPSRFRHVNGEMAVAAPGDGGDALATICRRAMRHYPAFNERIGRMAVSILGAIGPGGLGGIHPDWARVLAFEAVLYYARSCRGELREAPAPGSDMVAAFRAAQAWAGAGDLALMQVPYTGVGTAAMQAVMLSRDAGTLAGLALGLSWGVAEAPALGMWEDAEEMHAFAAFALDRTVIMRLEMGEAERVASCAVRYCIRAEAAPDSVVSPLLPPSRSGVSLAWVMAAARPALPNGVRQRLTPQREALWSGRAQSGRCGGPDRGGPPSPP